MGYYAILNVNKMCFLSFMPGTDFIELLKQKILLKSFLLSKYSRIPVTDYTILAGNLILESIIYCVVLS